jgi:hypothetical protein
VERVGRVPAVGHRVGQRLDDLSELGHRSGPAVRDDQRDRFCMGRPEMDEMAVQAIDLGHELGKRFSRACAAGQS